MDEIDDEPKPIQQFLPSHRSANVLELIPLSLSPRAHTPRSECVSIQLKFNFIHPVTASQVIITKNFENSSSIFGTISYGDIRDLLKHESLINSLTD